MQSERQKLTRLDIVNIQQGSVQVDIERKKTPLGHMQFQGDFEIIKSADYTINPYFNLRLTAGILKVGDLNYAVHCDRGSYDHITGMEETVSLSSGSLIAQWRGSSNKEGGSINLVDLLGIKSPLNNFKIDMVTESSGVISTTNYFAKPVYDMHKRFELKQYLQATQREIGQSVVGYTYDVKSGKFLIGVDVSEKNGVLTMSEYKVKFGKKGVALDGNLHEKKIELPKFTNTLYIQRSPTFGNDSNTSAFDRFFEPIITVLAARK